MRHVSTSPTPTIAPDAATATAPTDRPAPPARTLSPSVARGREERSRLTHAKLAEAHATTDEAERTRLLDEVVLLNRGVADAVANRFRNRGVPLEDLQQAAYEGLIKAVRRYDPTVRPDLLTYAVPTIRGEVQRWFRDQSWMVRPPRRLQELQWRINRSIERLSHELGRDPSHQEISVDVGAEESEVDEAVQGFGCFQPPSLDKPIGSDAAGDGTGATLADLVPAATDADVELAEARLVLGPALKTLSERDRRMLYLRFFEDQSQSQIGTALGITQVQVSRQLGRIVRDLKAQLT